jgi:hypothetical protein
VSEVLTHLPSTLSAIHWRLTPLLLFGSAPQVPSPPPAAPTAAQGAAAGATVMAEARRSP